MIWVSILLLVFISGTLSSSETALFKLDDGQRALASPRVRRLLEDPRSLLVTILLGNLIVNLAFFAMLYFFYILASLILLLNLLIAQMGTTYEDLNLSAVIDFRVAFARRVLIYETLAQTL